ncbi:beta-propeller fold lactonase family protein [Gordonia sp. NPDC003950]
MTTDHGVRVVNAPTQLVANLLSALGFNPLAATDPTTPPPAPALVFVWAAWHQVNRKFFNSYPAMSSTSQLVDPTTGVVTGSLGATDSDGDVLTYTVLTQPEHETVVMYPDGTYSYTTDPDYVLGLSDPSSTAATTDSFIVTASDETPVNGAHWHLLSATPSSGQTTTVTVPIIAPQAVNHAPTITSSTSTSSSIGASTMIITDQSVNSPYRWPWGVTPLTADGTKVAVVNFGANTVTFRDIAAGTKSTVQVGEAPIHLVMSPDGSRAYVNTFAGVAVIDMSTGAVTEIPPGGDTWDLAMTPDGGLLYVTTGSGNQVSVIDASTNTTVTTIPLTYPYGVAIAPDGGYAYVTSDTDPGTVSVIDTSSNTIVKTIDVGTSPESVVISPDGTTLYVANEQTVSIVAIDPSNPDNDTVTATISGIGNPNALAVSPDGKRLYVATQDSITSIDTLTRDVVSTTAIFNPRDVAVSPNGTTLYATSFADGILVMPIGVVGQVTATDEDPGDTITYQITTQPTNGIVTLDPSTGQWLYTTNTPRAITADSFVVTASDSRGLSTSTTVTIPAAGPTVTAGNTAEQSSPSV